MKKKILMTSAGGSAALGFIRSLKKADKDFYIIGCDANKYYIERSEADEKYLIPFASTPEYKDVILDIVNETKPDFIHSQTDVEILSLSKMRKDFDRLGVKYFLPDHDVIEICISKYESYKRWREAGLVVPKTYYINSPEDLKTAFHEIGPTLWIREEKGAFGKGSLPTEDYDEARLWIDTHKGWGRYTAAEMLDPQSMVTWQSIWFEGELVVAQTRKRLYWEFGNRAPSGVTGLTGAGVTVSDPEVDEISRNAILAIDKKPHGIFSVDHTYNRKGIPNPTEINIGRFFTTHHFFTEAGLNMPAIFTNLGMGEALPKMEKRTNPLPDDLVWVRGLDFLPKLTTLGNIDKHELNLKKRLDRISSK